MKKSIFYWAVAACIAVCNISCGSDDSDSSNPPSPQLPTPTYAEKAVAYSINNNVVKAASDDSACLTGLNFTESGKAIIEVTKDGKKKYVTYNVAISGDTYTITDDNGKLIGTVKSSVTRGSKSATINVSITITINGMTYTFTTNSATADMAFASMTGGDALKNIARTWTIKNMKLTLESEDPDFKSLSMTEQSGRLSAFVAEVKKRDTGFSDEDIDQLNKEVKSITLDQTGLLCIEYSDGGSDAATWSWSGGNYSNIALKLKDSEMGNKFIQDNTKIAVEFSGTLCKFTLTTTLDREGKKPFVATLNLVMQPK